MKTNIPFLLNLLKHPAFLNYRVTTTFIDETPAVQPPVPAGPGDEGADVHIADADRERSCGGAGAGGGAVAAQEADST
ncbi:MAG: hypothetical protein U0793_20785 [Gemmataceae bacterium]